MNRWWHSHSVRVRLTLWYVGVVLVVLGVYAVAVFTFVSRSVSATLDQQLRGDFQLAAAMVDRGPDGKITWFGDDSGDEDNPWLQVWSPNGELLYRNALAARLPLPESKGLAAQTDDRIATFPTRGVDYRVLSRHGAISAEPVVIQVGRSEASMRRELQQLALILLLGLPLGVAVAGLGGYSLARSTLAPIERMAERARSINADRLSDRLPVHNPDDELGQLATVFNETLGRLEASFEQMRQFTADVSHELRTPLTAIRSVGEVGLRERRDEADYRAIIGSMLEEVDRLAYLVDRVLMLSRAESGQAKLSIEAVDLRALAEDVASYLGVLAEEKGQVLAVEAEGTVKGLGDRLVLRQSLINLVDNAIKYTPPAGRITIRIWNAASGPAIDVSDTGPGIPSDLRTRIFDRYYRGRSRGGGESGGSGLGLAIAKWAVEVSGGRLSLEDTRGIGSTFRISLPPVVGPRAVDTRVPIGARA